MKHTDTHTKTTEAGYDVRTPKASGTSGRYPKWRRTGMKIVHTLLFITLGSGFWGFTMLAEREREIVEAALIRTAPSANARSADLVNTTNARSFTHCALFNLCVIGERWIELCITFCFKTLSESCRANYRNSYG